MTVKIGDVEIDQNFFVQDEVSHSVILRQPFITLHGCKQRCSISVRFLHEFGAKEEANPSNSHRLWSGAHRLPTRVEASPTPLEIHTTKTKHSKLNPVTNVTKALRLFCVRSGSWCAGSLVCSRQKRRGKGTYLCTVQKASIALHVELNSLSTVFCFFCFLFSLSLIRLLLSTYFYLSYKWLIYAAN